MEEQGGKKCSRIVGCVHRFCCYRCQCRGLKRCPFEIQQKLPLTFTIFQPNDITREEAQHWMYSIRSPFDSNDNDMNENDIRCPNNLMLNKEMESFYK
uniref:Uncharacterized protein n=1 Tax=Onchocerca volvulus TaxID=6282 RepID=A0A8R1Y3R3_ONCVO